MYRAISGWGVQVVGNTAYVAPALNILDVSDPGEPKYLIKYPAQAGMAIAAVQVIGTTAYTADGNGGIAIFDVGSTEELKTLGSYPLGSDFTINSSDIQVVGTVAYLVVLGNLYILDVSDPGDIVLLGIYGSGSYFERLHVVGTTAYLTGIWGEVAILDVSDPGDITLLGSFSLWDDPDAEEKMGIQVVGTTAYVAAAFSGFQVLDVSDLQNVTVLGSYPTPGYARDVQVVGTTVYVVGDGGLQILDVGLPEISLLGSYDTPGIAWGVHVVGSTAYVADGSGGLQIIDISSCPVPID